MRKQKGFSLIELLIVVAIILIIAAIAIPNLLRSRMAANEASAVGSVRTINTAEVTYATTYPAKGYAATLDILGGTAGTDAEAGLIDDVLAAGAKSGYTFTAVGADPINNANQTYTVVSRPAVFGQTGTRSFFSDQSGVIRNVSTDAAADVTSDPLQ